MIDRQPDPDALLASLKRDEAKAQRGRLKVFFGMCPGVGKTYAMLRAAQQELREKVDLVVGIVETHGRAETEALLEGLPVIPRRRVLYRDIQIEEMDLEAILARQPRLALVDELAHTNAPDSRHAKRYQDVLELLDAGIDVYTTLNIQHVESRADTVRQITGATVRETVPDSLLELADQIELIDLTPEALRERLAEGKVYLGDKAAAASQNFFQDTHLAALRELALRFTAERVEGQLRNMRSAHVKNTVWRSGERMLVAIGSSPFSTQLVRWTRRLAAAQGAPWIAAHIESSRTLAPEDQALLDKNMALARELGAEIVVTHDENIAAALVRLALQHNATQIIVGKPRIWRLNELVRGTLVDQLIRLGGNIDIYVVPAEGPHRSAWRGVERAFSGPAEYGWAAAAVALVTLGGLALPGKYHLAIGLIYLLAIVLLPLRVGRWPVLLAAMLSALTWDYLFIPPRYTFQIGDIQNVILFTTYFVVALVAGQLTSRIRSQARNERRREERAVALFALTRSLAEAQNLDEAVFAALRQSDQLLGAKTVLLLPSEQNGELKPHFAGSFSVNAKEEGVAAWAFRNRRPAGRFTDTLPGSAGYYVPLVRENHSLGVLGVAVSADETLSLAQRDLLDAFARQLALSVEREHLHEAGEREKLLAESEKLHRVLLDSVSHELRTPLAVITSAFENLADTSDRGARESLIAEGRTAARRLNRLVGNLLDQTRLESGALKPRLDWCDMNDIVNAALDGVRDALGRHPLEVSLADNMPPIRADFALTEQALANLLINASLHTPSTTPIFLTAGMDHGNRRAFFLVADRGPGFPAEMKERLFKKFSRGDAARVGGLGLGLSIVRGFIVAQGGEIVVGENPGGGAAITLYLPHSASAPLPPE
ncbi:MAG TPA: sensor histidine kinase KdpD [Opitutaceae bacterium]|nr:sensor histidine kinase KdpD [Opitutaceae bacterium]